MKRLTAIATLIVATSMALPAMATTPSISVVPTEIAQYRQTPPYQDQHAYRYRDGDSAYASHNGAPNSAGSNRSHDVISGWPCIDRGESSTYSAFPSWEICN